MKVSSFRRDPRAMHDGEWIPAGPGWGEIEVKTRAMLPVYRDAVATRMAREERKAGGADRVKSSVRDRVIIDCLIDHCLLDVRGLEHENGDAVTFTEFCDMIRLEEYTELAGMCITATGQVGRERDEQLADAVGNSPAASGIISPGAAK